MEQTTTTTGVWENGDKSKKFLQQQVVDQTINWTKMISEEVTKSSSNEIVKYINMMNNTHPNNTNTNHSSLLFGQHSSSSSSSVASSVIPKVIVEPMKALDNLTQGQETSKNDINIILHDTTDSGNFNSSDIAFILIPLIIIMAVALFSGFALVCMQRRVKLDRLRHRLIPIYTFSPNEDDEWEVLTGSRPTSRHKNLSESSSE